MKANLKDLLEQLGANKKLSNDLYKKYKELKEVEELLKADLVGMLKDVGLKSAKGEKFTASLIEKPTVVIKNEASVMEWLKEAPNIEEDFYIGIKKPEFNSLANNMLKDTGELIDGTEAEIREHLSIRSNERKK